MKKYIYRVVLLVLCLCFLSGCKKKEEAGDVFVYYIGTGNEALVTEGYLWESEDQTEQIAFVLDKMRNPKDPVECVSAIPSDVTLIEFEQQENTVQVSLGQEYQLMDKASQILLQAAVVHSLTQIDGIDSVEFRVGGELLKNEKSEEIGALRDSDFLLDTEQAFFMEEKHEQIIEEEVEEVEEVK